MINSNENNNDREYEEGEATNTDRKSDPLKEYSDKEALTPSKIKEHKPTAVKRDPNYQTKTEQGQPGTESQQANEGYRKRV